MATIRSYTTIEQSRKLEEILPLESADMYFEKGIGDNYKESFGNYADMRIAENMLGINTIPCWSLSALFGVLPNGNMLVKTTDGEYYCLAKDVMTKHYDNPIDACVAMILKLHELKML